MSETPHIVSDVMTRTVVAVGRDALFKELVQTLGQWRVSAMPVLLAEAARIMAVRGVKRLPVVDAESKLQGIVSRGDLLKVFLRSDLDIEEEVRRTVVSYLFPGDSGIHVRVDEGVVTLSGQLHDTALIPVAARLPRAVEGRHRVARRPAQVVPLEGPGDERGGQCLRCGAQQDPFHGLAGT
ncbi:CBS domain-containing protein [Streptomyces sp. NPDC059474]|uniref:CBS domain-containing protein n=1 Tax=Streptomyces sp. NPDC059474 TaxID=3346846 RepID=UPI0036BF7FAB